MSAPECRVSFRRVELLAKGEKYTITSLLSEDMKYSRDVVEHLVRYFWHFLSTHYESNELYLCIYCDIVSAVEKLEDPREKQAMKLMMSGYEIRDAMNGVAPRLGVDQKLAARICKRSYRNIAKLLGEK